MITYEATLVCDRCDEIMSGPPCDTPNAAEAATQQSAERAGWRRNEFGDLCQDCKSKEPEAQ